MTSPTSNPMEPFTPFLPTTFNIPLNDENKIVFFSNTLANFADVINDKKIGAYVQSTTTLNGNKFSYDTTRKIRNGYQFIARVTAYPSAGVLVLPVPAELNEQFVVFQVWGSASKPKTTAGTGDYFSFFGEGNSKITFTFTDQAITVTTTGLGVGYSGFICVDFIADGV